LKNKLLLPGGMNKSSRSETIPAGYRHALSPELRGDFFRPPFISRELSASVMENGFGDDYIADTQRRISRTCRTNGNNRGWRMGLQNFICRSPRPFRTHTGLHNKNIPATQLAEKKCMPAWLS